MDTSDDPLGPSSAQLEWRAVLEARWDLLRRAVFGVDSTPVRSLSTIRRECERIAAINAWYQAAGNLTQAAAQLGTSRKRLRELLASWRTDHPHLVPRVPTLRLDVHNSAKRSAS